jgi:hypothetical protein
MDATTCSLCLLVGVVMMLQAIYLVLAMVGRFVCGKGKPADVARPAPAGLGPAAVVTAAVPGAASATVPAHVTHNHHEDEEEHAGATDDDSHGSMEAEAEEKEEEEEEVEEEEEEVQDGRETGKSDFRKMLKNSEENSTCCRLYGLLIDQMGEHGRGTFEMRVGREERREGGGERGRDGGDLRLYFLP